MLVRISGPGKEPFLIGWPDVVFLNGPDLAEAGADQRADAQ